MTTSITYNEVAPAHANARGLPDPCLRGTEMRDDTPLDPMHHLELDREREAVAEVDALIVELVTWAKYGHIWQFGDGDGGAIFRKLLDEASRQGLRDYRSRDEFPPPPAKALIPVALRWEVWARDDFTCKACGTRLNLSCDHIVPESKGGPTTLENLQTLCRPCNSRKGVR